MSSLALEILHGCFAVNHRDNDISVIGVRLLLDDDEIAVQDPGFDHALANHAECGRISAQ